MEFPTLFHRVNAVMNKMGLGIANLMEFYGWKNVVIANRENHWQCEGAANAMQEPFKVSHCQVSRPTSKVKTISAIPFEILRGGGTDWNLKMCMGGVR